MTTQNRYHTIFTRQGMDTLIEKLSQAPEFALDLETTGLNPRHDQIVGFSFSAVPCEGVYIPIRHNNEMGQLPAEEVIAALKPFLEETNQIVAVHHPAFDTAFLMAEGIHMPEAQVHDTLLETWALATGTPRLGLKDIIAQRYGLPVVPFESLFPQGDTEHNIANVPIHIAADYACQDADYCLRLHQDAYPQVKDGFSYRMENAVWPILRDAENTGIGFDQGDFRVSAQELLRMATHIMGMAQEFPTPQNEQTADRFKTLISQLDENNPLGHIEQDGRIHSSYRQVGYSNGQCLMCSPDMDSVMRPRTFRMMPSPASMRQAVSYIWDPRRAMAARPNKYLVEVDLRQPEVALLSNAAGQDQDVQAYQSCGDMHGYVASVTGMRDRPGGRNLAKWEGYKELYGPDRPAADCLYPGIRQYLQGTLAPQCLANGYVETQFGRKINLGQGADTGRVAMCYAKGTASDYSKLALLELRDTVRDSFDSEAVKLVAFIGGRSIWEVDNSVQPWNLARIFQARVKEVVQPVLASVRVGHSWGDMEEIR